MGFHSSPLNDLGDLFLTTHSADSFPYCHFPYLLTLTLTSANLSTNSKKTTGRFFVILKGSLNISKTFVIVDDNKTIFKEVLVIKRLIKNLQNLGNIKSIVVNINRALSTSPSKDDVDILKFEQLNLVDGNSQNSIDFCTNSTNFILSGKSVEYFPCFI